MESWLDRYPQVATFLQQDEPLDYAPDGEQEGVREVQPSAQRFSRRVLEALRDDLRRQVMGGVPPSAEVLLLWETVNRVLACAPEEVSPRVALWFRRHWQMLRAQQAEAEDGADGS